jgi:two-component system response regulator AtoC
MDRPGEARCVLVTDDDPLVRWAIAARLADLGLVVIEAGSIRETLACEERADLVLLDVRLPDGDGLAAAHEILRRRPSRPLLLMTAFATPELSAEARRIGVRRCIDKPFDVNAVTQLVEELLRR